jgi:hypothetical protein
MASIRGFGGKIIATTAAKADASAQARRGERFDRRGWFYWHHAELCIHRFQPSSAIGTLLKIDPNHLSAVRIENTSSSLQ